MAASAFQVLEEGLDQVRVLLQVVVEEGAELFGHEALDAGEVVDVGQDSVDPEILPGDHVGRGGVALQPGGQLCLPMRAGNLGRPPTGTADRHAAPSAPELGEQGLPDGVPVQLPRAEDRHRVAPADQQRPGSHLAGHPDHEVQEPVVGVRTALPLNDDHAM